MSLSSEWLAFDELFEINESGIISLIENKIEFINIFEMARHSMASGYEKKLIKHAKKELNSISNMIKGSDKVLPILEEECENLMKKIHNIVNDIIDFTEFEFLN